MCDWCCSLSRMVCSTAGPSTGTLCGSLSLRANVFIREANVRSAHTAQVAIVIVGADINSRHLCNETRNRALPGIRGNCSRSSAWSSLSSLQSASMVVHSLSTSSVDPNSAKVFGRFFRGVRLCSCFCFFACFDLAALSRFACRACRYAVELVLPFRLLLEDLRLAERAAKACCCCNIKREMPSSSSKCSGSENRPSE